MFVWEKGPGTWAWAGGPGTWAWAGGPCPWPRGPRPWPCGPWASAGEATSTRATPNTRAKLVRRRPAQRTPDFTWCLSAPDPGSLGLGHSAQCSGERSHVGQAALEQGLGVGPELVGVVVVGGDQELARPHGGHDPGGHVGGVGALGGGEVGQGSLDEGRVLALGGGQLVGPGGTGLGGPGGH